MNESRWYLTVFVLDRGIGDLGTLKLRAFAPDVGTAYRACLLTQIELEPTAIRLHTFCQPEELLDAAS